MNDFYHPGNITNPPVYCIEDVCYEKELDACMALKSILGSFDEAREYMAILFRETMDRLKGES